ncbi:MAG: archaellin/type IV pilin N-terminal domain-containing protein [Candidatus Aenigmatarchaeota archaeon]
MKGISPLIASALLIVITIVIAGLIANWATTLSKGQLEEANKQTECAKGTIDIISLGYTDAVNNKNVTVSLRNIGKTALTGIRATLIYDNETYDKEIIASLNSLEAKTERIDSERKPLKIEIISLTCPQSPVSRTFP